MLALVENIKTTTQLRMNKIHKFRSKIQMQIEMGPYLIKTAQSPSEIIESFKLRHQVFRREFCNIERDGLDFDRYDFFFDHLIIVHKESQKIIGTYRLNSSQFSTESYTAIEFDLKPILKNPGPHLELGRACIAEAYRKGSVIALLWRGIAEYMKLSNAQLLYGCSSLKISNARSAALVTKYLMDHSYMDEKMITRPTTEFQMEDFSLWYTYFKNGLTESQNQEAQNLIPALLKSYLNLGAKISGEPAFDRDFDCIDFLTILHRENLSNALAQKFKLNR